MKTWITVVMSKALVFSLLVCIIPGCKKCYDCQFHTVKFTTYIVKQGDTTIAIAYGPRTYRNHETYCYNADTCWTFTEDFEFTKEVCVKGDPTDVLTDEPIHSCVPK